jgi:predicted ribosomally synthesized peptide with nif11-like leader
MSEDQLREFLQAIESNAELKKKVEAAGSSANDNQSEIDILVAIAHEAGYTISAGDLLKSQAADILELSDEELEAAAGGFQRPTPQRNQAVARTGQLNFGGSCGCAMGGGRRPGQRMF